MANDRTVFQPYSGRQLAIEGPAEADMVVAVPNCARCAAQGYGEQSGIPVGRGFTTNHYAGRSFIMPTQAQRDMVVKMKLNVIRDSVRGKVTVPWADDFSRASAAKRWW